jgi:hypothetical protein
MNFANSAETVNLIEQRAILATNDIAIFVIAVRVMQSGENKSFLAELDFAPARTAGSTVAFCEGLR